MSEKWMIVLLILLGITALYFVIVMLRDSSRFITVKYKISSQKLREKCKIVMLSDLHNKEYGENNKRLIQAIDKQQPDLILIAGDMLTANEEKTQYEVPLRLIRELSSKYPIYYGMGNHEYRVKVYKEAYGDKYERYISELKKCGVRLLENERIYLPKYNLEICGLEIERCYYKRLRQNRMRDDYIESLLGKAREDCLEILLAHNPDYFEQYAKWGADLTFSGHVHGGVMRLPFLGGVISPAIRLFPKYDGGLFTEYGKTMILGRGLGMHTIPIRVWNPGELIVVEME